MAGGELLIKAAMHPTQLWVTVPLTIAERVTLFMVLDSGSPQSGISPAAEATLINRKLIEAATGIAPSHILTRLAIEGQAISDLRIKVINRLGRLVPREVRGASLDVDGVLGLDFLGRYTDIHINIPSLTLRLIP